MPNPNEAWYNKGDKDLSDLRNSFNESEMKDQIS